MNEYSFIEFLFFVFILFGLTEVAIDFYKKKIGLVPKNEFEKLMLWISDKSVYFYIFFVVCALVCF